MSNHSHEFVSKTQLSVVVTASTAATQKVSLLLDTTVVSW